MRNAIIRILQALVFVAVAVSFANAQDFVYFKKKAATGTTAFCPADADLCQDFEGATSCFAAYDSVCDFTFDGLTATGGTIDFTETAPATYPCATTINTNVVLFDKTSASSTNLQVYEALAADEVYIKFWWRLDTLLSADTTVNVASIYDGVHNIQLQQTLNGANPALLVRYKTNETPTYANSAETVIAEDTWYKITIHYKKSSGASDGVVSATVGATSIVNVTNNDATTAASRVYLGGGGNHTATWRWYLDNIAWDIAAAPPDCAN